MSTLQKKFGENVKKIRRDKGLSQLELGISCELEKTAISRIENGRTNVTLKTVEIVARALQVEPHNLLQIE